MYPKHLQGSINTYNNAPSKPYPQCTENKHFSSKPCFSAAGVVKMRRGQTAKYMADLVAMRDVYEAFDDWARQINSKCQRVRMLLPSPACPPSG